MFLHVPFLGSLLVWALCAGLTTALTVGSTILVFARDSGSAVSATSGLNGYGIPFEVVLVPQAGITLPSLTTSATDGKYGGFIIMSELAYEYPEGWHSALTTAQWQTLYDYQTTFGVRMTRLDVYPTSDFGATTAIAGAGCCASGVEQLVSFTSTTDFPTSGLKTDAGVSTQGLWHYPATITNTTTTKQIAKFAPSGSFTTDTVAAVINTFGTRQQLVWFISWGTEWSQTSNFLMHAHIHWMTRGLYLGWRRINLGAQIDDMLLSTELYQPAGSTFRLRTTDLSAHVTWQTSLNSRLPAGSNFFIEIGYNGNGNIEASVNNDPNGICVPGESIGYDFPPDTPLEWQKPLGTGTSLWPATPASFTWSKSCLQRDALANWFINVNNRNAFAHVSHTFTHLSLNNATYADTYKEIQFNQAWFTTSGLASANKWSPQGLIPPAITGMHNGDAIKAWLDRGILYAVGDNSRPPLLNTQNEHWALTSNVADNGYAGLTIIPRWSNPIYYNCDMPSCTLNEWIATSGGWGDFNSLLDFSRSTYTRALLALRHDPFMFHQANMRRGDTPSMTIGPVSGNLSLLQIFIETLVQEMMRLTTWPIVTKKHDDIGKQFVDRKTRDLCAPKMTYTITSGAITGATVTANSNSCTVPIPVTFPGTATASGGTTTDEKLGSDPLTKWTTLSGSPVTFTLGSPITL